LFSHIRTIDLHCGRAEQQSLSTRAHPGGVFPSPRQHTVESQETGFSSRKNFLLPMKRACNADTALQHLVESLFGELFNTTQSWFVSRSVQPQSRAGLKL